MADRSTLPVQASSMPASAANDHFSAGLAQDSVENVAAIYNDAGDDYAAYADGDPARPFTFGGLHSYADRHVWALLERKLSELKASGASAVRFLDAGCGPGTWLRRLVIHARSLGFTSITARGFDIAQVQVRRARLLSQSLARLPGVEIAFDVADLTGKLPEADGSVDISLCLYSVLSHLPVADVAAVATEFARVTSGHFITTVRSIGSPPTAFVHSIENVRRLRHDHPRDRCEIELDDGRHAAFNFHMFTASELQNCFANQFEIEDVRGLDLFHGRFAPDPRWNPEGTQENRRFSAELEQLEMKYATNPEFLDRATHLLLVARSRQAERNGSPHPSIETT